MSWPFGDIPRGELPNPSALLCADDCRATLSHLPDNSIDSCVTDPPYGLFFMGRDWDRAENIAFRPETWAEVLRVLKPGAHLAAFGGTRTYHRLTCAIEDAGFEVRDAILWHYGTGFPKSHDVSKGIDRAAGIEREIVGRKTDPRYKSPANAASGSPMGNISPRANGGVNYERAGFVTAPATPEAAEWQGWGTALKPATEIICLARKPLSEPTVAANVLRWGTGAINVDACRIDPPEGVRPARSNEKSASGLTGNGGAVTYGKYAVRGSVAVGTTTEGRWPANVVHDGSEEVVGAFPQSEASKGVFRRRASRNVQSTVNVAGRDQDIAGVGYGDSGSAARFFYSAKADADDRLASKHPTVKPVDLMQWLCRLITPPGGTILDPFAGTGTTGEAAIREGFRAVLIEREPEYQADIRRRMALVMAGPEEKARALIVASGKAQTHHDLPLFAEEAICA